MDALLLGDCDRLEPVVKRGILNSIAFCVGDTVRHLFIVFTYFVLTVLSAPSYASLSDAIEIRSKNSAAAITFRFNKKVETGQYINGDWWVLGPVTIQSISPEYVDGRHYVSLNGLPSKNRVPLGKMGIPLTDPTSSSPLHVTPGNSVIKLVTLKECGKNKCPTMRACNKFAAVLTVVSKKPTPETFRPPYYGQKKPNRPFILRKNALEQIPSLPTRFIRSRLSFEVLEKRYTHVQWGEHSRGYLRQYEFPVDNHWWAQKQCASTYHGKIASENALTILRFMLDDADWNNPQHKQALVSYLQYGIDLYWMAEQGVGFGSHAQGRKIPVAFAAAMFDDKQMKEIARKSIFQASSLTTFSKKAENGKGKVLWALSKCSERDYWK